MQLKEIENQTNHYRQEIAHLGGLNKKEMKLRIDLEQDNNELTKNIHNLESEVRHLTSDLSNSKSNGDRMTEDLARLNSECEIFKNHIIILTEQNQQVFYNYKS